MALTERYVTVAGAGAHDGTSEANAFTWAEMITDLNTPRVGYRYNVKSGTTYTLATTTTLTGDGTPDSPNIIRGYKTNIGDLDYGGGEYDGRTNGNGPLITTDLPLIAYDATYYLNAVGANYLIVQNLRITGTRSGPLFYLGTYNTANMVSVQNASTNAAAVAISAYIGTLLLDCDADLSGGAGSTAACIDLSGSTTVIGCHVLNSPTIGIRATATNSVLIGCVVDSAVGDGIAFISATTTHVPPVIVGCTIYSSGGDAIQVADAAFAYPLIVVNCSLTDSTNFAIRNEGVATRDLAVRAAFNRTRDNTDGVFSGFTDSASATSWGHVTTDTGAAETDFVNAAAGDFRLIFAAPGKSKGLPSYADIGALQRAEPTLPADEDVEDGVQYGDGGTQYTGTFTAPNNDDVLDGVQYGGDGVQWTGNVQQALVGDVEAGTHYGPSGALTGEFVVPLEADVKLDVEYGDTAEFTGTYVGGAGGGAPHFGDRTGGKF